MSYKEACLELGKDISKEVARIERVKSRFKSPAIVAHYDALLSELKSTE